MQVTLTSNVVNTWQHVSIWLKLTKITFHHETITHRVKVPNHFSGYFNFTHLNIFTTIKNRKKMKTKIYFLTAVFSAILCSISFAQDNRIWATYYGSTGSDGGFSTATDAAGNVYLAGITQSQSGIASGGFQNNFGGGVVDAYLVKFDSSGNRIWATYYGGPGDEMAFFGGKMGIATDASNNIYLAGFTNSTSGIASGGFQNSIVGTESAYLVKFDASGNRLWATYYDGNGVDKSYSVATDPLGNVYLGGIAGSASGIASGGFQNTFGGITDAFLVKFDGAGNRIWATYYGGTGTEEGFSVATDNASNVYLAGTTTSTSGIASGGYQNIYGGGANDVFLVKFDSSGVRLWATYFGGAGDEMALFSGDICVTTDISGNAYLTGLTNSTSNIASGGFQNTFGGGANDAFLIKLNPAGSLQWSTYYGGTDDDKGYNVTTDASGNIYLVGRTLSSNAIASGGFQNSYGGGEDAFLVKFAADGSRLCATYFGDIDVDECNGVAVDAAGNIYLAGGTVNTSGIAFNGFQNIHGGGVADAILVKFTSCFNTTQVEETFSDNTISVSQNPTSGNFIISSNSIFNKTQFEIYNVFGDKIFDETVSLTSKKEINIENVSDGIYFIHVIADGKMFLRKLLKM